MLSTWVVGLILFGFGKIFGVIVFPFLRLFPDFVVSWSVHSSSASSFYNTSVGSDGYIVS